MEMIDGSFDGTELSFRCHHCGDSKKDPSKAHCSVNVFTGTYYCYRCTQSGKLSSYEMSIITRGLVLDFKNFDDRKGEFDDLYQPDALMDMIQYSMRPGPGIQRFSALDRWHIPLETGDKLDVFKVLNLSQELMGYHVRPPQDKHKSRTYGRRFFGMSSKIDYSRPWRLVEGTYDALDRQSDLVCFGFPSKMQAKALYGKEVILCPDGDVWQDYRKLKTFMKHFIWDNDILVYSIEKIPDGRDPDECLPSQREVLSVEAVRKMLTPKKTFFVQNIGPSQIMADLLKSLPQEEFWEKFTT